MREGSTPPEPDAAAPTEVRAQGLSKSFGERQVLRHIDLEVPRGQIVAIVGASGSGKTVLLDLLTGLMKPESGRVLVADHSRADAPLVDLSTLENESLDEVRLHWAIVFQKNALFSGSVRENIAFWLREHTELSEAEIEARIRESLTAAVLDAADVIDKNRDELSGGMAKRVAIARAIAIDPALIFYDEPTTGLDPVSAGHIHELIYSVHHRPRADGSARTSIVVTHDKDLLRRIQPRVVMLHDGGVYFDGAYEDFNVSNCPLAEEYLRAMPVLQGRGAEQAG
jgi:phospholipid/cholesterol/gamma-HCH transport system ATP-binding protein